MLNIHLFTYFRYKLINACTNSVLIKSHQRVNFMIESAPRKNTTRDSSKKIKDTRKMKRKKKIHKCKHNGRHSDIGRHTSVRK
jgi:hypothetical protein